MHIDTYTAKQYETISSFEGDSIAPRIRDTEETASAVYGCASCEDYTADAGFGTHLRVGDTVPSIQCNNCGEDLVILQLYQYDEEIESHHVALAVDGEKKT